MNITTEQQQTLLQQCEKEEAHWDFIIYCMNQCAEIGLVCGGKYEDHNYPSHTVDWAVKHHNKAKAIIRSLKCLKCLNDKVDQCQEQDPQIPEEIMEKISELIKAENNGSVEYPHMKMKCLLKKLGYTELYENIDYIQKKLRAKNSDATADLVVENP